MAVLIDSGFLFASLNASEREHRETVEVLAGFRDQIVFPVPAITEVTYLLARDISNEAAADFVGKLATGNLTLENPTSKDYERTSQLLVQYSDASVDFRRWAHRSHVRKAENHPDIDARSSRLPVDQTKSLQSF